MTTQALRVFHDGSEPPGPGTLSLWFEVGPDDFSPGDSWDDALRCEDQPPRITEDTLRVTYEDRLVEVTTDYPRPAPQA